MQWLERLRAWNAVERRRSRELQDYIAAPTGGMHSSIYENAGSDEAMHHYVVRVLRSAQAFAVANVAVKKPFFFVIDEPPNGARKEAMYTHIRLMEEAKKYGLFVHSVDEGHKVFFYRIA